MLDDKQKLHEYCLRCGRKLKTEATKKIGYGPVCEKKIKRKKVSKLF